MKKTEIFGKACIEIRERDLLNKVQLKLGGKGREKAVTLKPAYSQIASQYLGFELVTNRKVFSYNQVIDVCKKAELYVSDVVSTYL